MNLADKVAKANILAPYLNTTDIDLARELADRRWNELAADPEFLRLFYERAVKCSGCGCWGLIEDAYPERGFCEECEPDWDDYDDNDDDDDDE